MAPATYTVFNLEAAAEAPARRQTVCGYRVKVTRKSVSSADGEARRDTVNKLVAQSVRQMREKS